MPKQMVAANKTLSITELLELIILELPRNDIIAKATRVCKAWDMAITTSPRISHHLGIPTALNQSVVTPTAYGIPGEQYDLPIYASLLTCATAIVCRKGPYRGMLMRRSNGVWLYAATRSVSDLAGDIFNDTCALERVNGGRASWRKMYATSPPCTTMQLRVYVSGRVRDARPMWRSDERFVSASVRRTVGITFADIEEVTTELLRTCWDAEKHSHVAKTFRVLIKGGEK